MYRKVIQCVHKSFADLGVGEFFGLLEGSDVDLPYEESGRVFIKTRADEYNPNVCDCKADEYINAVAVSDDDISPFIFSQDEQVVTLEKI